MELLGYVLRRLAAMVPVILGVTFVSFLMIYLVPGDPARTLLGVHATETAVAALHEAFGLNEPVWRQYLGFLGNLAHGDLGRSFFYEADVSRLVVHRLPATLWLLAAATILTLAISVPLATLAAVHRGSLLDQVIRAVPLLGLGMPAFWLGIMLVLVFGLKLRLFPVSGFGATTAQHFTSIVLPGLTVALAMAPFLIRSLRAAMVTVLASDYVATARAKGLTQGQVLLRHTLRNAAVSAVAVLGVNVAYLVGSTVVVERVFALPGLGTLMLDAIYNRDFPVVQGVALVFAVMVVLINLLTDVTHRVLDPRVKLR